ncbi:MAG: ABC transporter ATP-binding protein, partial [Pararhizobium sp.]
SLPALEVAGVSRTFRRRDGSAIRALSNVAVSIAEGEFVCIVGPSGCGKSTLLHLCAGLDTPNEGMIAAAGAAVLGPGPDRGVVFQKDSVFPWMTVIDNVEYGLRCRGVPSNERRALALTYLDRVGLAHVAGAWPWELSGGMLKRVAIATVFANGSKILLLDEPFGALDYVTRHKIHDVLLELWDEGEAARRTVLFVTHDVDEALTLADRILVMREGRIVDDLRVESRRPRSEESLSTPHMIDIKRCLLDHLGLGRTKAPRAFEVVS